MKIGFIGLGKLGLPCALGFEQVGGFEVVGFDLDQKISSYIEKREVPYKEANIEAFLLKTNIKLTSSISELVDLCDIIFVAVQTPHEKLYEGITPTPNSKRDFDYSHLKSAVSDVAEAMKTTGRNPLIVVISTVLPGTMKRDVIPILKSATPNPRFCYNPYFIAMGTTLPDFLNPEFVLVGTLQNSDAELLTEVYSKIHNSPVRRMSIESAELTKVAYNTFIGFKIVFANTIAEICDARGGNADEVTDALSSATTRLMSPKYMRAGMGDGGGCHPRDQIAMSWMAEDSCLSVDVFGWLARARDAQTHRQATLIYDVSRRSKLPIVLLGATYKPETNLTIGSPALLLGYFLKELGAEFETFDPHLDKSKSYLLEQKSVFFISTNHEYFSEVELAPESIVIDPWGLTRTWGDCEVIRPGRQVEKIQAIK